MWPLYVKGELFFFSSLFFYVFSMVKKIPLSVLAKHQFPIVINAAKTRNR